MTYKFIQQFIVEGRKDKLIQRTLPYAKDALEPVKSKETIDYHYGTLYQGYVDRYNRGEGDADFNEAGAFLHNIYFAQFKKPDGANRPYDAVLQLIEKRYGTYDLFKDKVETVAMKIQGSGWVYLAQDGNIKTIKNHEIKNDIVLLIDWWEHAFALDYQADKKKYLENIWRIIDWRIINGVLGQSNQ
jgi:Fe-Mn family superoxide dismutase